MVAEILAAFNLTAAAISNGSKAIMEISGDIKGLIAWQKEMATRQWVSELHTEIEALKQATTVVERQDAAKALQDKIRSL